MNEKRQIVVWDQFVRFFHWAMILLIFLAYVTADIKGPLHKYIGFGVLGLVAIRIFWGFRGTKYALFSNFVCSPVKAINYLKELGTRRTTHYTGHNPAAAWMILLLLSSSIIICLSGYAVHTMKRGFNSIGTNNTISFVGNAYADDDKKQQHGGKNKGRERHSDGESNDEVNERSNKAEKEAIEDGNSEMEDSDGDSIWSDIHEMSAQFMLILICLHIVGVVVSSKVHNENLVKGIITGRKDVQTE